MAKRELNVDFDGQRENENTLFVFRRSVLTARKGLFLLILSMIVTYVPFFVWREVDEVLILLPIVGSVIGLLSLLNYVFIWYFTIYIVTDQRIRYIDQKNFFASQVIDLPLSKVENISYNIPGLKGSIFGFGNIVIQTLAGDLTISHVSHPAGIYNKLQDAIASEGNYEEINQ